MGSFPGAGPRVGGGGGPVWGLGFRSFYLKKGPGFRFSFG
jgi:hypothetical protein